MAKSGDFSLAETSDGYNRGLLVATDNYRPDPECVSTWPIEAESS